MQQFVCLLILCVMIRLSLTAPTCDQIYELQKQYPFSRTRGAYLSVPIPDDVHTEFELKVLFHFPFKLESVSSYDFL